MKVDVNILPIFAKVYYCIFFHFPHVFIINFKVLIPEFTSIHFTVVNSRFLFRVRFSENVIIKSHLIVCVFDR